MSFSEPWDPAGGAGGRALARLAAGLARLPQEGRDLGERLRRSVADLMARGLERVVIFGSDSPALPAARLSTACDLLRAGERLVLGPAEDGGYCLIGLREAPAALFEGIPWGTEGVLQATFQAAARAGIRPALVPRSYDVDRPEDLDRLRREIAARPAGRLWPPRATAACLARLARAGRLAGPRG